MDLGSCGLEAVVTAERDRDLDLAAAVRARDPGVVHRLVTDFTPAMLRLARAHTGSSASAEDVVQDAWITVLTGLERFEGRSALRTWVLGIVVHKARRAAANDRRLVPLSAAWRDDLRGRRTPAVDPDRFAAPGGGQPPGTWVDPPRRWDLLPEEQLAAAELRSVFEAALSELPVRQRAVLTARDVLGLSAEDVAGLYGLSEGNQRVLLHRGRSRVRAAVEQYVAGASPTAVPGPGASRQAAGGLRPGRRRPPPRPGPGQAVVCQQLVELVDDYLDGALDPDLRHRVEDHLAGCGGCSGYVAQVTRLLDLTRTLVAAAPPALLARLTAALRRARS